MAEAHRKLLADKSLQFDFAQAPPPPKPPPDWFRHLLDVLGPILKYVFWGLVIVAAALIIAFLVREIIKVRWSGSGKARGPRAPTLDWRPKEARARLLLAEADALAAKGLYAEAAHHLLLHSIQDVEDHRPRTIRPALTSRDISRLDAIPPQPRSAFTRIAELVEHSLFGGQILDADGFAEARRAYETFAFEGAWS
ncbi:MAG TPA: DUF4129 domain-containing protein [Caulobacteraceae bacterium]|nr:DUF4129 domain-containing protein [Caulobacteraceae bacterium]